MCSCLLARTASPCRRAYILTLWIFLSFFRRLISEVIERISTKIGDIFTHDSYLKDVVRTPPGIYHPRAEENAFWDRL